MAGSTVQSRVRTTHTPEEAEHIALHLAQAWPVSAGVTAEATKLDDGGGARFQEWSVQTRR